MNKFEQVFSDERQMSLAGGWRVPGSHDQGGGVKEDPSGFISGGGQPCTVRYNGSLSHGDRQTCEYTNFPQLRWRAVIML